MNRVGKNRIPELFYFGLRLRACFKNRKRGRLTCSGRRPADRNRGKQPWGKAVPIGSNRCSHFVRRVAGRHRRVACATKTIFQTHCKGIHDFAVAWLRPLWRRSDFACM